MSKLKILKWILVMGFLYFFSMSLAHLLQLKIPGLYIFYAVPSYAYQDKIISILSMGWALFYLQAALNPGGHRSIIRVLLVSGALGLFGLAAIALDPQIKMLNPQLSSHLIWLQIVLLLIYFLILLSAYKKAKPKRKRIA